MIIPSLSTMRRQALARGDTQLVKRIDEFREAKRMLRKVSRLIRRRERGLLQ